MSEFVVSLVDKVTAPAKTMASATTSLTGSVTSLAAAFAAGADPAAGFQSAVSGLAGKLGSLGAFLNPTSLAIAAITGAATLSIGALVGMATALYKVGLAAIEIIDQREDTIRMFDALTEGAGEKTFGALSKLADQLPFTTTKLADWAKGLAASGLRGAALERGVLATASATALLGDETGEVGHAVTALLEKFSGLEQVGGNVKLDNKLLKQLAGIGLGVQDLSAELQKPAKDLAAIGVGAGAMADAIQNALIKKGKPAIEDSLFDLPVIADKIRSGVKSLFKDLGPAVGPFLKELQSLASEFYKNSKGMAGLRSVVTSGMSAVFEAATRATRAIHIGFLDAQIAIFQTAVAVAPTIKWLRRLWDEHDGAGKLVTALQGIGVVAMAIGTALAFPLVILGAMAATGIAAVAVVANVLAGLGDALETLGVWEVKAYDAASDFVAGIVKGIGDGIASVVDAVSGLADAAVSGLKGFLEIQSPSKLTARLGVDVAAGMAQGIDTGAGQAEDASREMAARVAGSAAAERPGPRGGAGRGGFGQFGPINIEINVPTAAEALELTEARLADVLERVALRAGLVEGAA